MTLARQDVVAQAHAQSQGRPGPGTKPETPLETAPRPPETPPETSKAAAPTFPDRMPRNWLDQTPWIAATDLPSRFMPYPPGAAIRYVPFSWGEVLDINQPHLDNTARFREVLKGIETTGFPSAELTLMDFLFLGVLRRISTVPQTQFTAEIPCKKPGCGHMNRIPLTTDSLDFDYIKAPKLPVNVPRIGELTNCQFTPLRVGEWLDLMKAGAESNSRMMAVQMRSHPLDAAYKAMFTVDPADIAALKQVASWLFHGLKPIAIKCAQCGHDFRMFLDGWEAVLIPFRGQESDDENLITFG